MAFRYHNERLRYSMDQMIEQLKDACEGKDISIGSLIKDKDGNFDGDMLKRLTREVAMADVSEAEYMTIPADETEEFERGVDYLSTLLYVLIRAMQAKLGRVSVRGARGDDTMPVSDDTFASIIEHCADKICTPVFVKKRNKMFSDSMEATAETVYMLLTDKYLPFPDPYRGVSKEAQEIETLVEHVDPAGLDEADDSVYDYVDDVDFDSVDEDLFYDFYEDLSPEEIDAFTRDSTYFFYADQELEDYYHGDPLSEQDWHEYVDVDVYEDPHNEFKEKQYGYLGYAENKERFDKDARRLKLFFQDRKEYVRMYEHLVDITKEEYAGREGGLLNKIDAWLKVNEKMIYSDEERFIKVFNMICTAAHEARGKRAEK